MTVVFFYTRLILLSKCVALGKITLCSFLRGSYFSRTLIQCSVFVEGKKSSFKDTGVVIEHLFQHILMLSPFRSFLSQIVSFILTPLLSRLFFFVSLSLFDSFLRVSSISTQLFR